MRPKKGQIKNYIFERKIHSFQILFQWHLLVLRRKVSPEEETPSVWKIKSVCLEKIFLLGLFFASFGVAIVFFTPLVDRSHCFGSQVVIMSVLQLLFVFLCPLWHWPRWKLVVIVFFGTAKRTARLISQWVCGKTRKVGLLSTIFITGQNSGKWLTWNICMGSGVMGMGYWVLSIHIQPPFNAFDTMWTCQSLASGTVGGGEKGIQYLIWVLRSLPSIVFDTMWTCEWMARPGEGQLNTQYSIVRPMNPYPRTVHSIAFDTMWIG